jgi:hypothetical protein
MQSLTEPTVAEYHRMFISATAAGHAFRAAIAQSRAENDTHLAESAALESAAAAAAEQQADGELLQVQGAGYECWRVNAAGTRVTYDGCGSGELLEREAPSSLG